MKPELQKYYEMRLDMMASQAWNDLMVDVGAMLTATDNLSGVTPDNLRFRQGEVSMMRWMLSLKEVSEKAYEDLKDEDANAA